MLCGVDALIRLDHLVEEEVSRRRKTRTHTEEVVKWSPKGPSTS